MASWDGVYREMEIGREERHRSSKEKAGQTCVRSKGTQTEKNGEGGGERETKARKMSKERVEQNMI